MKNISHSVRQNLTTQRPVGDHPDADQLAAFSEQRLSEAERESVLVHLGTCTDCREIVALAAPEPVSATAQPAFVLARSWWSAPSVQWGAAAAAVAIAALGLVLLRPSGLRDESKVAQATQPVSPRAATKVPPDQTRSSDSFANDADARSKLPATKNEAAKSIVRHPGNQDDASETVASSTGANAGGNYSYASADQKTAPADVAALEKAKSAEAVSAEKNVNELAMVGRNVSGLSREANSAPASTAPARGASQTIEVTSESPAVLAAAKDAPRVNATTAAAPQAQAKSARPAGRVVTMQQAANARAANQGAAAGQASAAATSFTLEAAPAGSQATWRVNSGRLQHLDPDTGRWNDIGVGTTARLSVVGSAANEVWVGGTTGAMFYSNDSGEHWVPVSTGGWDKNATIIGLTPTARQSVEVHLSNGERWRSADAGASWNKYQ